MSDLEHLRRTLDDHADGVVDPGVTDRLTSVHGRIRVVRRRRAAAVAGAAAAVVAVAGGVAVLQGGDETPPPAADLVGVTPPAQLRSLGFTYGYADGVEGEDGRAVLRLPASDEPRLVSWATSGDDDAVRVVTSEREGATTYTDADFTNWTLVTEGYPVTLIATVEEGDPALAVYTVTDDRPPGVTERGTTFREEIAGGRLVDADIGAPGQDEVSVSGIATTGTVQLSYLCTGGPDDAWLHVVDEAGNDGLEGPACDDTALVDPASRGGSTRLYEPGDQFEQRLYVTRGRNGPRVASEYLRLAIAAYDVDVEADAPSAFFSEEFESDGHRWVRSVVRTGRAGDGPLVATAPADGSAVLALAESGVGAGQTSFAFEGDPVRQRSSAGGGTWQTVSPGARVTVRGRGGPNPDAPLRVAFYERAD